MIGDVGINVVPRIARPSDITSDVPIADVAEGHFGSSSVRSFAYDFILPQISAGRNPST